MTITVIQAAIYIIIIALGIVLAGYLEGLIFREAPVENTYFY